VISPKRKRALNWIVVSALGAAIGVFVLAYPYAIAKAIERFGVRSVALGFLAFAGATLVAPLLLPKRPLASALRSGASPTLGIPVALLAAAATGSGVFLQLVPAFIYWTLAAFVRVSLRSEVSLLERGVFYLVPEAPDFVRPYLRKLTALWGLYFAGAGIMIAALAFFGPAGWWSAFTGGWVYAAMIALTVVEFLVRKTWFRYYFHNGPFDRLWSRLFPAENTAQGRESMKSIREFREQHARAQIGDEG
jgi:uncharacterized membrane protein